VNPNASAEGIRKMMSNSDIATQLFSGAVSLAGLVLVFLGFIVSNYGSFDKQGQDAVKTMYQWRAWLAFIGFISERRINYHSVIKEY